MSTNKEHAPEFTGLDLNEIAIKIAREIGAAHGTGKPGLFSDRDMAVINAFVARSSCAPALQAMLDAYAPGAEETAKAQGEQSLHSAVRMARAALGKTFTGEPAMNEDT